MIARMLRIGDGWIDPEAIAAVGRKEDGKCSVYLRGCEYGIDIYIDAKALVEEMEGERVRREEEERAKYPPMPTPEEMEAQAKASIEQQAEVWATIFRKLQEAAIIPGKVGGPTETGGA